MAATDSVGRIKGRAAAGTTEPILCALITAASVQDGGRSSPANASTAEMGGYQVKNDLMQRLANSRALVTGGSRGIGAKPYPRRHFGWPPRALAVIVTQRVIAMLMQACGALVAELTGAGHTAFAFHCDVRDRAAAQTLARQAADSMGGLDVLISNAGVEYFGPLAGITEEDFRRVFDTNVAGQLYAVQAAVPLMTGGGRIVLMSSVSAGIAVFEHSLYAAEPGSGRGTGPQPGPRAGGPEHRHQRHRPRGHRHRYGRRELPALHPPAATRA